MLKMRNLLTVIFLLSLLLGACSPGSREYSRWDNIPERGWVYGDSVLLLPIDTGLPDNDSIVTAAVGVALRHGSDYKYSDIWLEVTFHGDGYMTRDTVNIRLADSFGRWLGSGFGASYQKAAIINTSSVIDITRPVEIRHIMNVDTLRGIEQIGVTVSPL